ncbi:hypothetical protein V491_05690 [Pseudogymnoascus sp. VKM F-3775]|nr:hypothetical protein V491_05690 [Pseudogymnoascus sp. VKM F-3775]
MSPAAQYYSRPPSRPQSSPLTQPALQPHMNLTENAPSAAQPVQQNFSQSYTTPVKSFYSDTYHAIGSSGNKAFTPTAAVVGASAGVVAPSKVLGNLPPQQQVVVENKSSGLTGAHPATDVKMPEAGAMDCVQGDIPDVDTDSAGMMETLMRNLQRAARQGQV